MDAISRRHWVVNWVWIFSSCRHIAMNRIYIDAEWWYVNALQHQTQTRLGHFNEAFCQFECPVCCFYMTSMHAHIGWN